jgi:hypothetical protein
MVRQARGALATGEAQAACKRAGAHVISTYEIAHLLGSVVHGDDILVLLYCQRLPCKAWVAQHLDLRMWRDGQKSWGFMDCCSRQEPGCDNAQAALCLSMLETPSSPGRRKHRRRCARHGIDPVLTYLIGNLFTIKYVDHTGCCVSARHSYVTGTLARFQQRLQRI